VLDKERFSLPQTFRSVAAGKDAVAGKVLNRLKESVKWERADRMTAILINLHLLCRVRGSRFTKPWGKGSLHQGDSRKFQLNSGGSPNISNARSSSLAPPQYLGLGVVLPAIMLLPSMQ
jgi:hypothetical protein